MHVSGVAPDLAQIADLGPPRSEIGIGALMPWAGKLYVQNYLSHKRTSGSGTSLRRVDADFSMEVVPRPSASTARTPTGSCTSRRTSWSSART